MSTTVDDRIVRMQFDSTGFEAGAAKVLNVLDRIGSALNLDGASAGLENVRKSIGNFNIEPVAEAVETTKNGFSLLEEIGVGAFRRLGEHAIDFGGKLLRNVGNSLTKSARDGFTEYQQQINSIQTISANTGESVENIQKRLDELNVYADKTSYNFSDMTSAIGRFTAAGIDVDTATTSIQGFFNAAALGGADSTAAARGVYQLSQAMSAGVVQLQDWRSLENANLDTARFKDMLVLTAKQMGVTSEEFEKLNKGELNFRESLKGKWLTSDVMAAALENLTKSTLDYEDAEEGRLKLMEELTSKGYSEDVAKQIIDIASAADSSAREIRTFKQLMDTINESAGSGWAETWRLIFGDLDSATEVFSWLGKRFGDIISESAAARNAMIKDWVGSGGRDALIGAMANIIEVAQRFGDVFSDAFSGVFGVSGNQLAILTENVAWFSEKLVISEETMNRVHDTLFDFLTIVRSVIGILGNGIRIIGSFASAFMLGFGSVKSEVSGTDTLFTPIATFLNKLHVASDKLAERFEKLFVRLRNIKSSLSDKDNKDDGVGLFGSGIERVFKLAANLRSLFNSLVSVIKTFAKWVSVVGETVWQISKPLRSVAGVLGSFLFSAFVKIIEIAAKFAQVIAEAFASFVHVWTMVVRPLRAIFVLIEEMFAGFFSSIFKGIGNSVLFKMVSGWVSSIANAFLNLEPSFKGLESIIAKYVVNPLYTLARYLRQFVHGGDTDGLVKFFTLLANILTGPVALAFGGIIWVVKQLYNLLSGPLASAWNWIVEQFSKVDWTNPFAGIIESFKSFEIKNPFEKFEIPKKLAKKLDSIKTKLTELGTSADDAKFSLARFMKQAGSKIKTSGKNGFDALVNGFKDTWNKLKTYFTELTQNGNSLSENIAKIFGDIYDAMRTWIHTIAEGTDGFGGTIAKGFDFLLEKLGKIPGLISTLFGNIKKTTSNGVKNASDGAEKFAENQRSFWSGIFDSIPSVGEIVEKISGFFGGIKENISGGLKNLVFGDEEGGGLKASLAKMFDFSDFKIVLPDFASPILDFVDQFNEVINRFDSETLVKKVDDITTVAKQSGGILAAWSGFRFINSFTKLNNSKAFKNQKMGDLIGQWPQAFKGIFEGFGTGFGTNAGKEIGGGLKEIAKGITEFGKSFSPFQRKQAMSKSFKEVAEGILILAGALFVMSRIPADDLERAGMAMLKLLGVSAGFTFFAAYLSGMAKLDLKGVGLAMAGLGLAMIGMAGAIYMFTKMSSDPNIVVGMQNFKLVVELLAVVMAGLMLVSQGSNLKGVAITMLALVAALNLSLLPIVLLGLMPTKMFVVGSERFKSLMFFYGMIGGLFEVLSSVGNAGAIAATALSLVALVAVLTFSLVPVTLFGLLPENIFTDGRNRVMQLGVFFAAVEIVMGRFIRVGVGALKASIAMIPVILALTLAIIPVTILGMLPEGAVQQGEKAVFMLGVLMGALLSLFNFISVNMLSIGVASLGITLMVIPITAMTLIVTMLSALAAHDLNALTNAIDTLYNIVVVIASMAVIGVLGGGGLFVLAGGLAAITAALWLMAAAVDAVDVNKFVNSLKSIGTGMGEAGANVVTGFIGGVASALGQFGAIAVQAAQEFLNSFRGPAGVDSHSPSEATKEIGEDSAEGFIEGVMSFFGLISDTGSESGQEFLGGLNLADLPSQLATSASEAVNSFINGINVDEIVQKGTDIATGLVNGIIENINVDELVQKGNAITQGLVDGLGGAAWDALTSWPGKVFNAIVDGIAGLFDMHSPSVVMNQKGQFILQGLIDGLSNVDILGGIGTAVSTWGTKILEGIAGLPDWVKTKATEAGDFFIGGFNSKSTEVEGASKDLSNKSVDGLKNLSSDMKTKSTAAAADFAIGLGSKVSEITRSMQQNVNAAKQPANGLSSDLRQSGAYGGEGFASGIYSKQGAAYSAGVSLSSNAKSGVGSLYGSMHSAGSSGAQGLIDGIRSKISAVANQAISMARTVVDSAMATLKVNSPSKVFIGIGGSVGEGFIKGIANQTGAVMRSSSRLAGSIPNAFSDTLKDMSYGIDDLINTDYNPVISPVIDPTNFNADLSMLSSSLNSRLASDVAFGTFNYNETFAGKFDELNDTNRLALKAFADGAIDYNALGQSVANALIRSGVHVEMDGGQLMGYLAGEIQDARRMYR